MALPSYVNNNTYTLVNEAFSQATGQKGISAIDTNSFVDMGRTVLSTQDYTDRFIQSLAGRITYTIYALRRYYAMFNALVKDYARGAVQKISFGDMAAESDQSFGLEDGQSVDMYRINKPKASQKFYVKEAPYQFHVSISRRQLENGFLNDEEMSTFIRSLMLNISNMRVIAIEDLAKLTLANMIVNTPHEINLLSEYNATHTEQLTAANAINNAEFLRYAVRVIRTISDNMRHALRAFNDGTVTRFTPREKQVLYVLSDFEYALETVSSYAAYHDGYVSLSKYETVGFWQAYTTNTAIKETVQVTNSEGIETTMTGIVATLFDVDALGLFPRAEWASTTPFNSAGGYSNTFWHGNGTWYNDLSENFVVFTIRDAESDVMAKTQFENFKATSAGKAATKKSRVTDVIMD